MEKDLLGMNLQYFAEPDDSADKTPPADDDDKAGNDAPTVTVAEMKRRLAKEQEAYQKQIDELKGTFQQQIEDAVDKAQKEAQLTGKELQEYKTKEKERELQQAREEIEALRREKTVRDMRDEATRTLTERGLTVNDKVLNFVVKDNAEDTLQAIEDMAELFKLQKEEFAQSTPPIIGGGFGASDKDGKKTVSTILDGARITK